MVTAARWRDTEMRSDAPSSDTVLVLTLRAGFCGVREAQCFSSTQAGPPNKHRTSTAPRAIVPTPPSLKARILHMPELNRASLDKYIRSVSVRQIRLTCGLVLVAYLLSHFVNHALGNISLYALATGVRYHTAFWKSLPIATVFYSAAAAHAGLGIWALYERRQFHWKAIEPIQLVLGLSIPALIITHLAGVRLDDLLFQHQKL
jgi:hypothetical protein